nr:hypothetical protein [Tanacetum cinerariifolium]
MEDTMLELVKIYRQKELLCMHDNVDDLIESALNSKLLSINSNSQRLINKEQEVKNVVEQSAEHGNRSIESLQNFRFIHKNSTSLKNTSEISPVHAVAPILSTKEPEYSPSVGYEHPNTTPEIETDEIIKSGFEELVPSLSKNKVTLEDKRECDVPISENSPICNNHSEIFFDSKIDDDISSDEESFEDIEYVEASLSNLEIFSVEEENIKPDQERLINVMKNDISDNSSRDPLLEEADLFLASNNSIPLGIENVANDSEGDIRFLEELLIDDSIPFPNNESSDSNFEDNPSVPLPPLEPPDEELDFEIDFGDENSVMRNTIVEFECLKPRVEFDVSTDENDDYSYFMFVMFAKVFSLLFAKKLHQLDTFYNALNPNDQDALDSAARGNFLDKIPRECLSIIESKSKVRYSRSRVTDSRVNTNVLPSYSSPSNSFDLQQIAASLEDKLDIRMSHFEKSLNDMKAFVTPPATIKEVEEVCVTCVANHSYNHCPLTRGGNEFLIFHDNIQQIQTVTVGNFV